VRRNDGIVHPDILQVNVGEINGKTDWSSALEGIDCVIHLAARVHVMNETSVDPLDEFRKANVMGTEHLASSAAAQGVKRLVYVSSIKVNGEETTDGNSYTEHDTPAPLDPYGISKWEAELALHRVAKETGLEVVIVRPPLVYGAGVKGNFERMLRLLSKGLPLPLASVKNLRSMIFIENLADALKVCATHPSASGKTYLLSDGEDISTSNLMRELAQGLGKPALLLPFPGVLLILAGKLFGKSAEITRLLGSLQIDSGKIRRELNWQPPYTLHQGLNATTDWFKTARA
jgi:nucleoside-diphosphate-sugar epimerase